MRLTVNGTQHDVSVAPGDRLLDVLRGPLGLTGAKDACGRGECGTCTVLVAGLPVMSCLTLACRVSGEITTVEGVAALSPGLSQAFADEGGFQCGFCTPGQLVTACALVRDGLPKDAHEQRVAQSGNLCRCTGYEGILRATRAASATAESASRATTADPLRPSARPDDSQLEA